VNGHSILQPIIGWGGIYTGINGKATPNASGDWLWEAAYYSWGGNAVAATVEPLNPGDTISTYMHADACDSAGGGCHWLIYIEDVKTGLPSDFTVVSSPSYYEYVGGAFESYGASNCNMLFGGAHLVWRNLSAEYFSSPGHETAYTPNFGAEVYADEDPCSMYAANYQSENGGDILWTP
jgi:hypothetical protein